MQRLFELDFFIPHLSIETLLAITCITTILAYLYCTRKQNLPPGPHCLPVLGYLPFLSAFPPEDFIKLGKKYGPIFSLHIGSRFAVVLNSYDVIKEAFQRQSDKFSIRPQDLQLACGIEGYIMLNHPIWKLHRSLAMKYLRDIGLGKTEMESKIMNEVIYLTSELETNKGKSTSISEIIAISVANITCNIIFGTSYSHGDKDFLNILKLYDEKFHSTASTASWTYIPWLKKMPAFNKVRALEMKLLQTVQKNIDRIKETHQQGNTDTFINAYLTEMADRKEAGDKRDNFNESNLSMMLDIFFQAGSETGRTWLTWAILEMMINPDIQNKVHEEINQYIGRDRFPQYTDRVKTPYTEATLLEVGRIHTLVPLNVNRENSQHAIINGYTIPAGTLIISNLWNVLHDPKLWTDPEVFRPARFLSDKGTIQIPEFYIPFSIGKLNCLGEGLAKLELYLYFTTMMQRFAFERPEDEVIDTRGIFGITYTAKPFKCIIHSRE